MSNVLTEAVVRIGANIGDFTAGLQLAKEEMDKAGKSLQHAGETLTKYVTAPLIALGTLAVKEFADQEDALAKLNGVIASTGGIAGVTTEHIVGLAESLQKTTRFSHEVTESAASVLLTFQDVRNEVGKGNDIFDRTIKAAQGLAGIMGGDLNGAVRRLGIALEDPEAGLTLLRRTGVVFSEGEKAQIKDLQAHGHALEAQRLILDAVEHKFRAVAEAMANTPTGHMTQAWNEIKEALEGVGAVLAPLVIKIADSVKKIAEAFQKVSPEVKQSLVVIAAIVAAIGPSLLALAAFQKAWVFVRSALLVFGATAGAAALTIGLLGAAIAAWGIVALELGENWNRVTLKIAAGWIWLQTQAQSLWTFIVDKAFDAAEAVIKLFSKIPIIGKLFTGVLRDTQKAHQDFLTSSAETLSGLAAQQRENTAKLRDDLLAAGDAAVSAGVKIHHALRPPPPPIWAAAAKKALEDLDDALQTASDMAKLLGPSFDVTGARASAYQKAVEALTAAHVPLTIALDASGRSVQSLADNFTFLQESAKTIQDVNDAVDTFNNAMQTAGERSLVVGGTFDFAGAQADAYGALIEQLTAAHVSLETQIPGLNLTLGQLEDRYKTLKAESKSNTDAQDAYNAVIQRAKSAVEAALTPQQIYQQTMQALAVALANNVINQDAFNAAVAHAKEVLEDATKASNELKQGIIDLITRSIDGFIDMALKGKQSFREFVASAIQELLKLIIKIELMNLLFGPGGPLASLTGGKIPGRQHGGFVKPGEVALVGETGPELVSGGRAGVNVQPVATSHMATASGAVAGGDRVGVHLTLQVPDPQAAQRFLEQNESMLTGLILKAVTRSRVLRSHLGAV